MLIVSSISKRIFNSSILKRIYQMKSYYHEKREKEEHDNESEEDELPQKVKGSKTPASLMKKNSAQSIVVINSQGE